MTKKESKTNAANHNAFTDHPKRRSLLASLEVSCFVWAVDSLALAHGECPPWVD